MDDEAYARRLLAILTNPSPSGIDPRDPYGQADDGIDRHDGFGRDVWAESIQVVEGEHGSELEVEFGIARGRGRGVVRLPFDRQWRELSGYDDPAAYAPEVASRIQLAAHELVEQSKSRGNRQAVRERARNTLPPRDVQWQMLLDGLASHGPIVERADGGIDVRLGVGDVLTVVVTPDQWEDALLNHVDGDVDLFLEEIMGPRDEDEKYVVFYDGNLVRSTREELPPVRGRAFERDIAVIRSANPDREFDWRADPPGPDDAPRDAESSTRTSTRTSSVQPVSARVVVVAGGLVVGVGLNPFNILLPWTVALAVATVGFALKRRFPLLLWLALGVAAGAIVWLGLGLAQLSGPTGESVEAPYVTARMG